MTTPKYPDWLYGHGSFMDLPKAYQEWVVRWYYYNNTDQKDIPDTVPVENIEEYIVDNIKGVHLWCMKGFATARNVDNSGDNILFQSDSEFFMVVHYVARLYYKKGVECNWFESDITKEEFQKRCFAIHLENYIRL